MYQHMEDWHNAITSIFQMTNVMEFFMGRRSIQSVDRQVDFSVTKKETCTSIIAANLWETTVGQVLL